MFKKFFQATLAVVTLSSALPASAAVILSSDFTGTSGDASNVTWTENDVSVTNTLDPQDSSLNSLDLFSTYSDVFAVDHNLHDDGDWFVDIFVSVSDMVQDIALDFLSLDVSIFNNAGAYQSVERDLSFSLEIFDGVSSIFSQTATVYSGDSSTATSGTESVLFDLDLANIILNCDSNYTFTLTASGIGRGTNAGFDNFLLTGNSTALPSVSVSAPGSVLLLLASLLIMSARLKKKS